MLIQIKFILTTILYKAFDPLEQFDIINLCPRYSFSQILIFFIIIFFFIFRIILFEAKQIKINKNYSFYKVFGFQLYKFVEALQNSNIIINKTFLLIIYVVLLIILLASNCFGLIPFYYTLTSSFIVAVTLALLTFIYINIIAIYRLGFFQIANMFLPVGTPWQIGFLLAFIEAISYLARLLSLSIRLFANMMAGHTLLKILIGFSFSMLLSNESILFFSIIPWIIIIVIFILEILISILQAYVFTILICIYVNDTLDLH